MLRFVVLIHFVVDLWFSFTLWLIGGLLVFEKQEGVAFLGASCFWRTLLFALRFVAESEIAHCLFGKKIRQVSR